MRPSTLAPIQVLAVPLWPARGIHYVRSVSKPAPWA